MLRRFLVGLMAFAAFAQSFRFPGQPPRDLPPGARNIAKAWFEALGADDWKTVARLGMPHLRASHAARDGGADHRCFRGFTHYAAYMMAPEAGKSALDHILKAYQDIPEQGEICYQAGRLLLAHGRPAEAIRPLEDAVRLHPIPGAKLDLAVAHNGVGRFTEALSALQELDRTFPGHRRIRFELAWSLTALHREGEALGILQDLLAKDPKDAQALQELGFVLIELGQPAQALPHLKAAAALRPRDYSPWSELVTAHLALGQVPEARLALAKARALGMPASVAKAKAWAINHRKAL